METANRVLRLLKGRIELATPEEYATALRDAIDAVVVPLSNKGHPLRVPAEIIALVASFTVTGTAMTAKPSSKHFFDRTRVVL